MVWQSSQSPNSANSRAGADDVYCVGPQETVLAALQQFATDIKQRCDLEIQWSKTVLYTREGDVPAGAPPGLKLAGDRLADTLYRGLMVYGVPVGSPEYVTLKLREKAAEIVTDADRAREVLALDRKAL